MLLREYASIKNWIEDGLISSASSEPLAARTPVRKGWCFQWRRCPMKLPICRTDSLPVPDRMPGTWGISETSRQDNDLLQRDSCSRPWDPETADNCSGWAQTDLIITGYRSMMLMMRMVPEFRSKAEIWRPSNWLGLSSWKPPPYSCTRVPATIYTIYWITYEWMKNKWWTCMAYPE